MKRIVAFTALVALAAAVAVPARRFSPFFEEQRRHRLLDERVPGREIDKLAAALSDPDGRLRRAAAEALSRLGARATPAVAALGAAVADPDPAVAEPALRTLAALGASAREAVPALKRCLELDLARAEACALLLSTMDPPPKIALRPLIARLNPARVPRRSVEALFALSSDPVTDFAPWSCDKNRFGELVRAGLRGVGTQEARDALSRCR